MSISIDSALVVGLPYDSAGFQDAFSKLSAKLDEEGKDTSNWNVMEEFYNLGIETFHPYYDAGYDDCFIGIPVDVPESDLEQLSKNISKAFVDFQEITGYNPCVRVVNNVI